jgi:hypothetical protein
MKFWMNSCASAIGSPTGTPRRMRSLVFMVLVRLKMVGAACGHTSSAQRCLLFSVVDWMHGRADSQSVSLVSGPQTNGQSRTHYALDLTQFPR